MEKSTGSISASAYATILANGLIFKALSLSPDISTTAQAPSLILEALAAVIVPVLEKAGANWVNLLSLYFFGYSSSLITSSPFFDLTTIGVIYYLGMPLYLAARFRA